MPCIILVQFGMSRDDDLHIWAVRLLAVCAKSFFKHIYVWLQMVTQKIEIGFLVTKTDIVLPNKWDFNIVA